jgi:hypothetical protein
MNKIILKLLKKERNRCKLQKITPNWGRLEKLPSKLSGIQIQKTKVFKNIRFK